MSNLFQKLGKSRPAPAVGSTAPRLTLAAFGKHPGWDDHMPGIGVETETLAYIKQTLYVTGIGRQIDSGAWEKLEADKRQEGFDHTFLWLRSDHLILGQIWSSKDGKGRAKYPMVLCVDGEGVTPSLLLNVVRPGLEALRDACKAAISADQVASNCRAAQEQLRMLLAGGALPPQASQPGDDPRRFLERPDLGPNRLGLLRVLHELRGNFGAAGDTRASSHGAITTTPSLHFRVPLAADSQNSALLLWAGFLRSALSSDVPLVLMARAQADWLDVVVGEPKADDFFFLQASQKGFPLVTQIPYELASNATTRLREVEVRFRGEAPTATEAVAKVPPPLAPPASKAPPPAPPPLAPRAEKPAPPPKGNTALIAGSLVVVLIAALVAWMLHGKPGDQSHFDQLLASGKALLDQKKYDDAIRDLDEADKIRPNEDQVKQMLEQARRQRDSATLPDPYQLAMKSGRSALEAGDCAKARADAGTALSIKPDDADAMRLRDDAQAKLGAMAAARQKEADFQSALKNGHGALARGDYTTALREGGKSLSIKPEDPDATRLRDDAQAKIVATAAASQKEAGYQSALKDGRAALERGDPATAVSEADKALALKQDDGGARQLRADAQAKLAATTAASQKEADYQSAMKDGRGALASGDYANALTDAGKALSIKADDADATQLRDGAQAKLGEIALANQKEADYHAAIINGRGALARGDFTNVLEEAAKALALKPDDADAKELRDVAKQKLSGAHAQSFTNSIQMVFVWVPGVGADGAFLGKYEVTEQQFQTIMGGLPNGQTAASPTLPVAGVSFQDATQFCEKLSERENKHYTLPTRQQWLSAAGLSEDQVTDAWKVLSASGALDHEATSRNNNPRRTKPVPVGSMGAQTNGVCDMFGNVREWVSERQRAGFSYSSNGVERKGELFFPDQVSGANWIEQETGLRCILEESTPH
jgi:tetratricopeptide (TPR) repeat protein